ncbi:glycosyltransferase family 2 protein [Allochromatium vinosum]|uniref:glycosyltransferase family 2 protein n=1 Tax=Allochromatium vinosum TaxID=1049 RepID=UPI001905D450|nr:glycosyltransferase family 2 protein [Allochromatium vinosum]
MTDPLRISAVIPAYNAETFLKRSVDSALAQTFQPLEIIVVDDGSTDGTAEIAKRYGEAIRYIRQENGGGSAARNTGIKAAQGDWIAFLDVDDQWRPHHLANAAKVLRKHPEIMWYGAPVDQYIHETGKLVAAYKEKKPGILVDGTYFDDYLIAFPPYAHFSTPTMVINRSVFSRVGVFKSELTVGEDIDLWFRIGLHFPKVGYCHEVAANIYKRGTSLSYTKQSDYRKSLATYCERERLAEEMGEEARRRVEPRIMYWVTKLLKASLSCGDTAAVREIYSIYSRRLAPRWRWAARLYLAAPWATRPAFALRNAMSAKQRAFQAGGLR